ncbi:WD40/YVTN/BNR-like repeat-containing protein, partial [Candidatus Neomarinimicrobiota bacterium]
MSSISVAPSDSNIVYAALIDGCLFKSDDAGETWERKGWFRGGSTIVSVHPFNADSAYVGIVTSSSSDGLFVTGDGGDSWTAINSDFSDIYEIVIDPINPLCVYVAGRSPYGLYKTMDAGTSWNLLTSDLSIQAIGINPVNSNFIYAALSQWQFIMSSDYGESWGTTTGIGGNPLEMDINPDDPNIIYIATSEGLAKSTDGGAIWILKNNGEVNRDHPYTSHVLVDPNRTDRIYRSNNHNWITYKSEDGGEFWSATDLPAGVFAIAGGNSILSGTRDGIYAANLDGSGTHLSSKGLNGTSIVGLITGDSGSVYAATLDQGIRKLKLFSLGVDSTEWTEQIFHKDFSQLVISPHNSEIICFGHGEDG